MKPEGLAAHLWFLQLIANYQIGCRPRLLRDPALDHVLRCGPGHAAEDGKFSVNCKSGRSVVQVRSIEGELQQHAVAGGLDDPAPWLASVSVFIAQFLFGNIPNLPATLASSVENV